MESEVKARVGEGSANPQVARNPAEVLWDCAGEALILAFLIQIFGNIALGIVGEIWKQMMPSLPPVVAEEPVAGTGSAGYLRFFHQHELALLFGIILVCKAVAGLAGRAEERKGRWMRRVSGRIAEEWFGLIVVNAFIAFGAVMVVELTQRFSLTHILWQFLGDLIRQAVQATGVFSGSGPVGYIESWLKWYHANHLKLLFWFLYMAAICDDLGVPNYKTWARWGWKKLKL